MSTYSFVTVSKGNYCNKSGMGAFVYVLQFRIHNSVTMETQAPVATVQFSLYRGKQMTMFLNKQRFAF